MPQDNSIPLQAFQGESPVDNYLQALSGAKQQKRQEQQAVQQDKLGQQTLQMNDMKMHQERLSALNDILSSVPDGDAQALEVAKQRALSNPNLGLRPEDVAAFTIADLPGLKIKTGQAAQMLDLESKRASIDASRASIRHSDAATQALRDKPQGGMGGLDNQTFDNISGLRKEYTANTKDFATVRDAYGRIKATASSATPAGDIAMIYAYMKMLDPGSVVRETEFSTAQNAKPLLDRMGISWDSVKSAWEGTRLQPSVRADFLNQANGLFRQQSSQYDVTRKTYTDLARKFNFNPELVVTDQTGGLSAPDQPAVPPAPQPMTWGGAAPAGLAGTQATQTTGPVQIRSAQDYEVLPSGATYISPDGHTRTKR